MLNQIHVSSIQTGKLKSTSEFALYYRPIRFVITKRILKRDLCYIHSFLFPVNLKGTRIFLTRICFGLINVNVRLKKNQPPIEV